MITTIATSTFIFDRRLENRNYVASQCFRKANTCCIWCVCVDNWKLL